MILFPAYIKFDKIENVNISEIQDIYFFVFIYFFNIFFRFVILLNYESDRGTEYAVKLALTDTGRLD